VSNEAWASAALKRWIAHWMKMAAQEQMRLALKLRGG